MRLPRLLRRKPRPWPTVSQDEIRRRARVLVVDDADFAYMTLFERDGYRMDKWDDVTDLSKLESGYYDVILLDIHGVGAERSRDEGLGILRHLKKVAPAQIIVAYSNADWALKYQEFFDQADAVLDKRADYVDFKRTLDELLRHRFSLSFYVDRIATLAAGSHPDISALRTLAEEAILRREVRDLEAYLLDSRVDPRYLVMAMQVAQVAIALLQVLMAK